MIIHHNPIQLIKTEESKSIQHDPKNLHSRNEDIREYPHKHINSEPFEVNRKY